MKNQIIPLGEKNIKVMGFSDEQIILSSKSHKTFESLLAATEKKGMLEDLRVIPVSDLKEIHFNTKEDTFTLRYDKGGKTKKETILLEEVESRNAVVDTLAAMKELTRTEEEESKTKPLLFNLLGVIAIPLFTWVFRGVAIDAQNGEHYVATGRRSGITQLVTNIAESIGPTWVTIIGVVGLLIMAYITYSRFTQPAMEVKYQGG
ncbi:MAG: hypothetical protein KDC24_02870 [Saprospiraceae bacterium]|nr:hypothetical protein [Saprospiraceae bacterium]